MQIPVTIKGRSPTVRALVGCDLIPGSIEIDLRRTVRYHYHYVRTAISSVDFITAEHCERWKA